MLGHEVVSVQFSKNRKYLLSSGRDMTVRLWDITAGKELKRMPLTVGSKPGPRDLTVTACFSYNENYVLCGDDQNNVVVFVLLSLTCLILSL